MDDREGPEMVSCLDGGGERRNGCLREELAEMQKCFKEDGCDCNFFTQDAQ